MLDKFLSVGANFDWISPLLAFLQDFKEGPSAGFRVPVAAGWSGAQIKDLLKEWGIRTWGWMIVNDIILFDVRDAQAEYAQYILERFGVPYQGGPVGERVPASGGAVISQKPSVSKKSFVDVSNGVVDDLVRQIQKV